MAMNIHAANAYSAYESNYKSTATKEKKETKKVPSADSYVTNGLKSLSKAGQELLKKLREANPDMDFMVADFDKGDNAKEILSRSTKEFTVIFSSEELEKMAKDEKYYNEKIHSIEGALRMSEEINAKYGFERGFGKEDINDDTVIAKFGMVFNSDGTSSLFAELEKTSEKQRERIEKTQEEKRAEQKGEKFSGAAGMKRVVVYAFTEEELLKKINGIDWSKIKEETSPVGNKMDWSI